MLGRPDDARSHEGRPGAFRLLNLDNSFGGTGPIKVADWIQNGFDGDMPLDWYFSDSGAKFNSSQIKAAMTAVIGEDPALPDLQRDAAPRARTSSTT